jgi:hypothetical protein
MKESAMPTVANMSISLEASGGATQHLTTLLKNLGMATAANSLDISIADLGKVFQVEFPILLDSELKNSEATSNTLTTMVDVFSGYLLQAINAIASVEAVRLVSKFSNADVRSLIAAGIALEAVDSDVIDKKFNPTKYTLALEAEPARGGKFNLVVGRELKIRLSVPSVITSTRHGSRIGEDHRRDNGVSRGRGSQETTGDKSSYMSEEGEDHNGDSSSNRTTNENSNSRSNSTSATRTSNTSNSSSRSNSEDTERRESMQDMEVTITVRGNVLPVDNNSLVTLFSFSKKDLSFTERWHDYRSGRIGLTDFLFMQDVVKEYKRANIELRDDVFGLDSGRRSRDLLYSTISGNTKINKITHIAIMTEATQARIERELTIDFDRVNQRKKLFDRTNVLMIAVVDRQWNRLRVYTRGYSDHTDVSMKDIDTYSKKSTGSDIMEFLKAFSSNNSPNF